MKVSLVFPRTKYISGDPPLGLAYLAAYARKALPDLEINILDSTFHGSLRYIKDELSRFKPDIVGIFVDTLMFKSAITTSGFAKEIGALVIFGGPHATVCPDSLKDSGDIIVKGEGETAFLNIINQVFK